MARGGRVERTGLASAQCQHHTVPSDTLTTSQCVLRASTCRLFRRRSARAAPAPVGHTCAHNRMISLCYRTANNSAMSSRRLLPRCGRGHGPPRAREAPRVWPASGALPRPRATRLDPCPYPRCTCPARTPSRRIPRHTHGGLRDLSACWIPLPVHDAIRRTCSPRLACVSVSQTASP